MTLDATVSKETEGETATAPVGSVPDSQTSVARRAYNNLAFLLSALLSPYIVIPVGTVGIVYARSAPGAPVLLWTALTVFFSTIVPAAYVVYGIKRGKITDVHVMEREQRGGPFLVAIISSLFSAGLLFLLEAPNSIWGLSMVIAANGVVLWTITSFYKISMHVSVLSAVVLAAVTLHPGFNPLAFLWLIPALIWARSARGRHTVWQGMAGCIVALGITACTLLALNMGERMGQMLQRLVPMGTMVMAQGASPDPWALHAPSPPRSAHKVAASNTDGGILVCPTTGHPLPHS